MRFRVEKTDNEWFFFLAERQPPPEDVNFWQPGGKRGMGSLAMGAPVLFELHSPLNYIVGGGFVVRHTSLPLSTAWDIFREDNGVPDFQTFYVKIISYRRTIAKNPEIGCLVLTSPFFFPKDKWLNPYKFDWDPNIQTGKPYDTDERIGSALWARVEEILNQSGAIVLDTASSEKKVAEETEKYVLVRARHGQRGFHILVMDAYRRQCAITNERALPALEAAHIKPHRDSGPNDVKNGLFLRADLHRLFDQGYMTLTKDFHTEVSSRIKHDFDDGEEYLKLHGKKILIPPREIEHPSSEFIEWHNEKVFLG